MTALTLVMNELTDLDPEEFVNVRAYHSCGKDFRQVLRAGGPHSPTNSESSGVSSLTGGASSTPSEDEAAKRKDAETKTPPEKAQTESNKKENSTAESSMKVTDSKEETKQETKQNTKQENKQENKQEKTPEEDTKKERIYYLGRDILNLERNTQPYKWQLTSPMFGFLNPHIFENYRNYFRFDEGDFMVEEYPMQTCATCNFRQPSPFA